MNSFEKFIAGTGILALSFLPLKSFGQTETNHQDTSKNPFYIRSGIGMKKFISSDIKKYPKFFPYRANLGLGFNSSKKSRIEISLNAYLGTKESKIESRNISAVSLELFYDLNLTSKAETISTYFGGGLKLEKINTYLTKNFEIFKDKESKLVTFLIRLGIEKKIKLGDKMEFKNRDDILFFELNYDLINLDSTGDYNRLNNLNFNLGFRIVID